GAHGAPGFKTINIQGRGALIAGPPRPDNHIAVRPPRTHAHHTAIGAMIPPAFVTTTGHMITVHMANDHRIIAITD
ncbi:MAG TPA: hypothetical protein VII80_04125, partial [Pseudolabrys sp.]